MTDSTARSRWSRLNPRHLLSVLTAWFGLCWALIEFASFLATRYGVSEAWIDCAFAAMWALLPTVVLVAWWIAAPGPMLWTPRRVALATLFSGLGLTLIWQASRQDPTLAERGASQLTELRGLAPPPKAPQIALFPFKVLSADPTDDWLSDALPVLAEHDLLYDTRLRAASVASSAAPQFLSTLRGYGVATFASAPLALRRRAAQSLGYDALVVGSIAVQDDRLQVQAEMLRLNPDQALGPFEFEARDPWEAVDRLAALAREQLTPPDNPHPANDPSLRSISTESLTALKAYVEGAVASQRGGELVHAESRFAEAVRADPSFVMAELSLHDTRYRGGEIQAASRALESLEPKLGLLPVRFRYRYQTNLAMANGQLGRARSLYTLWVQQAPDDPEPRLGLAGLNLAHQPDDPEAWQALVELTAQHGSAARLLYLSAAALRREQLEDARRLAEVAYASDPANAQVKLRMAEIERVEGHAATAQGLAEEAWLLRPDLLTTRITLATFQNGDGHWQAALTTLADARERARHNPDVLAQVLNAQVQLLAELGRIRAANQVLGKLTKLQQGRSSPVAYRTWAADDIPLRLSGWGEARVRAWLAELAPVDDAALESYYRALVDERISFQLRDPMRYRQALQQMRQYWPASFGISAEAGMRLHEALCAAWESDDPGSLQELETALHLVRNLRVSTDDMRLAAVDQALRHGHSLAARRMLAPLLRAQSGRASMRWRSAQIAALEGDELQARRQLGSLLTAWAGADPDFEPAQQARALARRMDLVAANIEDGSASN